ncbi:unnamed protein product, partial [Allacma fusca]
ELGLNTVSLEEAHTTASDVLTQVTDNAPQTSGNGTSCDRILSTDFGFLIPFNVPATTKSELERYLEESTANLSSDPLKYWLENQRSYPNLAKLTRIYLGFPASTGDVERLFFVAGWLKRQRRNKLSLDLIQDILIVRNVEIPLWKSRLG